MAKIVEHRENDDLVVRARTEADALSRLYELYYDRILRFCVHRLFDRETAEDVTSSVFLAVASSIGGFEGRTEQDFRNWLYAIAANQTNACIRKFSRRKRLFLKAAGSMRPSEATESENDAHPDWPEVYEAIMKLSVKHQTIVTLRFFEKLDFDEIGQIVGARGETVRVTLHRVLKKLRKQFKGRL